MDSWGLEDEEELVQETFRHFTRDELEKIEQRIFDKRLSDKKKKDRQKKNVEVRCVTIPLFHGSGSGIGITKRLRIQFWNRIWGWNHNTSIAVMNPLFP